eukprot:1142938-Pelagomonas_calceolata.AAC.3
MQTTKGPGAAALSQHYTCQEASRLRGHGIHILHGFVEHRQGHPVRRVLHAGCIMGDLDRVDLDNADAHVDMNIC